MWEKINFNNRISVVYSNTIFNRNECVWL